MKLVPLGDKIVLKQLEAEETTKSGIVLPGQAKEKPQEAEVIAVGSPLYCHNICGSVRNVLDRFYGKVENGGLSGRKLYFLFQGAAPEKWMMEAGEYTMKRFAKLYGMEYAGMATDKKEAARLGRDV